MNSGKALQIHPRDNVAVALEDLSAGSSILNGCVSSAAIPQGHKIALYDIRRGEQIVKYGCVIGHATQDIPRGALVHVENMATNLDNAGAYRYEPVRHSLPEVSPRHFMGFRRADGRAAIRNEIWILPLVGCVNAVAQRLACENQALVCGSVDGLYAFTHPFGCSQLGDDHARTRKLLAALANHPNAAAVLVLALGCENNALDRFKQELGFWDEERVRFLVCQDSEDELADGAALLRQLAGYAQRFTRRRMDVRQLRVGLKCGGSDGLSGITANPAVGCFSDLLIAHGGATVLTEVPEMFGAESMLLNRCKDEQVFQRAVKMIERFKDYYVAHGQPVYENPSPGNKAGGISTLEDKSCGCIQKGGCAPVEDVLEYAEQLRQNGLTLLSAPGNDLVSTTALSAAGVHMILFTTGRGTPFGAPVPTVKISSNSRLALRKPDWIDFDAGSVAQGERLDAVGRRLMDLVLEIAGGRQTCAERNGYREISILKDGVVL